MKLSFKIILYLAILVVVLEFVDSLLTYLGLALGFEEINPKMVFFIENFGRIGAFVSKLPTLAIPLLAYAMIKFEPKNRTLRIAGYSIALVALTYRVCYLSFINASGLILLFKGI